MSSSTRQQMEQWLKKVVVTGNVLDVGGSQLPVEGRVHKAMDAKFWILDLPVPHVFKKQPDIVLDIEDCPNLPLELERKFDVAFCLEVSEYWIEPRQALARISNMLKKGGTLYISFHFIYPVHNPVECDSLRYTRRGASRLLARAGFEIKSVQPRFLDHPHNFQQVFQDEGMRPAKEYEFHNEAGILIEAVKK